MTKTKFDFKKQYKDLYLPQQKPMLVDVPEMRFIMVDGQGEPGGARYTAAMQALYSLTFTIKMSKMSAWQPDSYHDYVLPPLEGLWYGRDGKLDLNLPREQWRWTSMIRVPGFVTPPVFAWAQQEVQQKKKEVDASIARLEGFTEGLCVQMLHIGSYQNEPETIAQMHQFIGEQGYHDVSGRERKHHEIYLGDPRKAPPEKWRTVLRLPVEPQ